MDEELVILVQDYPALYDLSHKDYDNHLVKENMWKEIGVTLNRPAEECKSKWALLRSYFVKARGRRKTTSGQAAKKVKKWRLEDQMEYLIPFLQDRTTQSNLTDTDPDDNLEVDVEKANESASGSTSSTPLPSPMPSNVMKPRYAKQSQSKTTNPQPEQGLEQTLRSFISSKTSAAISSEKKALMVFFDDIAESMLKFSERERAEIKRDIFRIVNDKEIEKLIQSERASSTVGINPQPISKPLGSNNRNQDQTMLSNINSGNLLLPIHEISGGSGSYNMLVQQTASEVYDQQSYHQQYQREQRYSQHE